MAAKNYGYSWLAIPATSALLLAACGTSSTTSAVTTTSGPTQTSIAVPPASAAPNAAEAGDSCSIISQSQAGNALGHAVQAPLRGTPNAEGAFTCVFYGPSVPSGTNPDNPVPDSVRVQLFTGSKAVALFGTNRSSGSAQPVSGIGDQAFLDQTSTLNVLQDDAYLQVGVIGTTNAVSAEKTLATGALAKM